MEQTRVTFETVKLGICLHRATVSRKKGYSRNNERARKVSDMRDVDSEDGETQSTVSNNVVSWYILYEVVKEN